MKLWIATTLFAASYLTFMPEACAASMYKISDLEYLESQKDFKEFFLHAKDVRPAERSEYWKKMVGSMAQHLSSHLLKIERPQYDLFELVVSIGQWVELKNDDVFQDRKNRLMVSYFPHCIKDKTLTIDRCTNWLDSILRDSNPESKVKLLPLFTLWEEKLALEGQTSVYGHWDFIAEIVATPLGEFYCHKDDVAKILYDRLIKEKKPTVHEDCWKVFGPYIVKNFFSLPVKQQIIVLKWSRLGPLLTNEIKELFHLYYLLDGHWDDDEQNIQSFNALEKLSQKPLLREKIILHLKKVPFFPDGAFAEDIGDNKKTELLARLNESFPELLDLYTTSCLNYIEGKEKFSQGNPTLNCRHIMAWAKSNKMSKIFSQQAWNRFNKL